MAVYPTMSDGGVHEAPIDVEAWTVEQAAEALNAASISSPRVVRGTSVTIDIPLDDVTASRAQASAGYGETPSKVTEAVHTVYKRREPIRRDSLKRREALLKGKEGSHRLLNNPYAQPPLPSDWEVRPTYPVHSVPYYLAPFWDADLSARSAATKRSKSGNKPKTSKEEESVARVAKEVREKLKRARGARGLLQDLESEVRRFVEKWEEKARQLERDGLVEPDSEDEEIVFVGRNGAMSDMRNSRADEEELRQDKLIFDSLVDDHGASFGRWLVHSIATYYNLKTWSITTGDPARREAYVGLKDLPKTGRVKTFEGKLPVPLWGMV
ncbi:hypothetical protein LTR04_003362 [Oleoguttula sp. CCFEE 6159]|nr:hypothetical protein LTR04_003362 [Oleoguttula sp. CCFEE 6159]